VAVWLPKALLEQKIKLSNLRKLIFGLGRRNNKKSSNDAGQSDTKNETKASDDLNPTEEPASTETTVTTNQVPRPGHGRLPHSDF
jgi:transposase